MSVGPQPVKTVRAVKDLGRLPKGGSGSHLVECDDGRQYVVKFVDTSKNAVNEFVSHELAKPLKAPVYDQALVELEQGLVESSEDLIQRKVKPGLHQGTEYNQFARDLESSQPISLIANTESIPAIVVLDNLACNTDRNNAGNILIEAGASGQTLVATDFNCSFNGNWNITSIDDVANKTDLVPFHPLFIDAICGQNPFSIAFQNLQTITTEYAQTIVNTIPPTWPISVDERIALVSLIEKRTQRVPTTILSNKHRFPKWLP